jgi:hypothetical protein
VKLLQFFGAKSGNYPIYWNPALDVDGIWNLNPKYYRPWRFANGSNAQFLEERES